MYDAETRDAARQVTQALGLLPQAYEHGITPALRSVIRTPSRRTPTQAKRAKARAPYRATAAATNLAQAFPWLIASAMFR